MHRFQPLRFLVHRSATVLITLGILLLLATGEFAYRNLYRTIVLSGMIDQRRALSPSAFIDERRVNRLRDFFQLITTLPPIASTTTRDVFSTQPKAASAKR